MSNEDSKIEALIGQSRLTVMLCGLLDFILGTKCSACGHRGELRSGCYTRAYNELCEQADGEHGFYCMNCRTIHFDTPDFAEWLAKQPEWIKPHNV